MALFYSPDLETQRGKKGKVRQLKPARAVSRTTEVGSQRPVR